MYKKIIETTILNLSIGTTAPAESSCKTLYQQSLETACCSTRKADIGKLDCFPFAKISNLAIISNA